MNMGVLPQVIRNCDPCVWADPIGDGLQSMIGTEAHFCGNRYSRQVGRLVRGGYIVFNKPLVVVEALWLE